MKEVILIDMLGRRNIYVDRLVVIAGPSGVGKTFLVNRLGNGPLMEFSKQLGITELGLWSHPWGQELEEAPDLEVDRLIFPYDLARLWKFEYRSGYSEDALLKILHTANDITVVTLWARPEIILRRFRERRRRKAYDTQCKGKAIIRMLYQRAFPPEVTKLYRNAADLQSLYHEWIRFCGDFDLSAHWLADTTSDQVAYCALDERSFRAMIESLAERADGV
jgi:hypothetical protein